MSKKTDIEAISIMIFLIGIIITLIIIGNGLNEENKQLIIENEKLTREYGYAKELLDGFMSNGFMFEGKEFQNELDIIKKIQNNPLIIL